MALLNQYVKAVRTYLPKGAEADDIATELTEHLRSKIEDREDALGRPLTELEQDSLLAKHGAPLTVASRYGRVNHGLAFGRQLIGPELFPLYVRSLVLVFGIALIIMPFLVFSERAVLAHPLQIVVPMLFLLILLTSIFVGLDGFRRWSRRGAAAAESRDLWSFPGVHLRPTPRWLSAVGFVVLGLLALWWTAVPRAPALALGDAAAGVLELAPAWSRFYWPILALLLASLAHRIASLARPDWNWLRPASQLAVNALALMLLYPILRGGPFFEVSGGPGASAEALELARTLNDNVWWYMVGFGTYWLVNVAVNAWLCAQHVRYRLHRRR
jgi:hypothetical protein